MQSETGERKILVHFFALISEDFKLDVTRDRVLIRGELEKSSRWENMSHIMKYTG